MSGWPDVDNERLTGVLLRVDLYERRYLAVGEHHNVVNHLLRSASAACLLEREDEAQALIDRAGQRMVDWVRAVGSGATSAATYVDFGATRGMLAFGLVSEPLRVAAERAADDFLAQTTSVAPGSVHNARLAAAALLGNFPALQASARACELSDAGLGLPWRRFATAIDARDATLAARSAQAWLREKLEATHTNEWGAYNEVPIEVSGALGLAAARGLPVRLASNRVLTRYRA
jgi:hypothetical protein